MAARAWGWRPFTITIAASSSQQSSHISGDWVS
jgi:hypothetical protein